jgi:hypothetical protein
MGVKKPKNCGKIVKDHKGYKVRMMMKTAGKNDATGKFGIYAGKKKVGSDVDSVELAVESIEKILSSK